MTLILLALGMPSIAAQPGPEDDCHRFESEHFVFHSDPWVNLHHFLFEWSRNVPERQAGDHRRPVEVRESAGLGELGAEDRQAWVRALDLYRRQLIGKRLVVDRELIDLRGKLAVLACSGTGPDSVEPELRQALAAAMPVYRRRWWPGHHAANLAWIRERLDQLETYETNLAGRLADAYGGEWPAERLRVDVAVYSNWAGAYTTNRPDHLTVSSAAYPGLDGLEILFHEVSHATFFEQRVLGQLAAAFRPYGADPPERLAHAIQFAVPAELVRSLLDVEERGSFRSIGGKVAARAPWRDLYGIVLEHWKPVLDGRADRSQALAGIAEAVQEREQDEAGR